MPTQQLLRDPNIEPTPEVIATALQMANPTYIKFLNTLEQQEMNIIWRYYKDGSSWLGKGVHQWTTTRGTHKEKTIFWLSIWEGFFQLSIYIAEKTRAVALELPLTDQTHEQIIEANPIGKLKFFPLIFQVQSDEQLSDIYTLLNFKKQQK